MRFEIPRIIFYESIQHAYLSASMYKTHRSNLLSAKEFQIYPIGVKIVSKPIEIVCGRSQKNVADAPKTKKSSS